MTSYYPVHLDLTGKVCLVVGGGVVAERKVEGLLEAGAIVRVVSPQVTTTLQGYSSEGRVKLWLEPYQNDHLEGATLVFCATNNEEVNAHVVAEAKAQGIFVNAANAFEAGDFIVPSVVRRGELCISLATGGSNPMFTARLAGELSARFGPEYEGYMQLLRHMRHYIKGRAQSPEARRGALAGLLDEETKLLALLREDRIAEAQQYAEAYVIRVLDAD